METYLLNKKCEVCNSLICDSFVNLLCWECYKKHVAEIELKVKEAAESIEKPAKEDITTTQPVVGEVHADLKTEKVATDPRFGIKDHEYKENPEQDDKDQVFANLAQFVASNKMLWYNQRNMYNFIKNYAMKRVMAHPQYPKQIWKPYIVDVGCGCGIGSNILSQEAHFVWGIDKNEHSIKFAKECFDRQKNQIYYSSQLSFDCIDLVKDNREFMQFDFVVAIEIIEHLYDTNIFLRSLIRFARKDKAGSYNISNPTEFFISTPNRNNSKIRKDSPQNVFHVREWASEEFKDLLKRYFKEVILLNQKGEPVTSDETQESPILAVCSLPVI